jgi:alcohol dehydrogenase class IV
MPWREPKVLEKLDYLSDEINKLHLKHVMIITDIGVVKAGLLSLLLDELKKNNGLFPHIYDRVISDPSTDQVEEGYQFYLSNRCDSLIVIGGGSSIDFAKGVGIRVVRPNKPLVKMKGILKVGRRLPPLIAIPTTAGTGSEVTLACVLVDKKTSLKFAISDFPLVPIIAVLDPRLTSKLPPYLTAITGMDAMTHAIEAYMNRYHTRRTKKRALDAIAKVFKYLSRAYEKPTDLEARTMMLKASYDAGYAFTRDYVGNIHAIAHTLGGFYHVPHGYANAIIMPYVLKAYGRRAYRKLAKIHDYVGFSKRDKSNKEKAMHLIKHIETLNRRLSIPDHIVIDHDYHLNQMVINARKEAFWNYPVPKIFTRNQMKKIFLDIIRIKK